MDNKTEREMADDFVSLATRLGWLEAVISDELESLNLEPGTPFQLDHARRMELSQFLISELWKIVIPYVS